MSAEPDAPGWLSALTGQLRPAAEARPVTLTPVAAIDELRLFCRSVADETRSISAPDRASLSNDVHAALAALGPGLRDALGPKLHEYERSAGNVAGALKRGEDAAQLQDAADSLETSVTGDAAVGAAWSDAVSAFETLKPADVCVLRLAQLRSLVERRGHDWSERAGLLAALLGDDARTAASLGLVPFSVDDIDEPGEKAGLRVRTRIRLCESVLLKAAPIAALRIWFCFEHAKLDRQYLRVGPVQLFGGEVFPHALDAAHALSAAHGVVDARFDSPLELQGEDWQPFFDQLPERAFVLARVESPRRQLAGSIDAAQVLVEGLVQVGAPGSDWTLLEGAAAHSARTGWFGTPFHRRTSRSERLSRFRTLPPDPTADFLAQLDSRFVDALAGGNRAALAAVDEVRWALVAGTSPAPQRLALRARTIERPLGGLRGHLAKKARERLRVLWSLSAFSHQLSDLIVAIMERPVRRSRELDRLCKEVTLVDGGSRTIWPGEVAIRAARLAELLPAESMIGRMAAACAVATESGDAAARRLQALDDQFDTLAARVARQRNTIVHGASYSHEVIATCDRFAESVVHLALGALIEAAGAGEDVSSRIDAEGRRQHDVRRRLRAGEPPAPIQFGLRERP